MPIRTIEHLLEETGLSIDELAEKAKLSIERMEAIGTGRWLPSPAERQRIAAAFGVPVDQVSWGHSMTPRNIRYHRFGLRKEKEME